MLKSKRFNGSMAAVVVLAVMLAVAVTAGATLAWFSSNDSASANFALGDSVVVAVADEDSAIAGDLDFVIPSEYLVPGMQIFPSIYADIEESTTSALLRASIDVTATWSSAPTGAANAPAGWTFDTDHYTDGTDTVDAVDADDIEGVYAFIIEKHLKDSFTAKANGWFYNSGDDFYYFTGNGASYSMVMTAVGTLSGDSYTNATYGAAGTLLNGATNETDPTEIVTAFTDETAAGLPTDGAALVGASSDQIASIVTLAQDETASQISTYSTPAYGAYAHVPFLVRPVTVPITWTNIVANASVSVSIEFQAVQDYLVNPSNVDNDSVPTLLTTLANAQPVFTDAFGA